MPSRKSFFKNLFQKLDSKKIIVAAIVSIVILFPTIFATVFVIRSNILKEASSNDSLTVVMYDSNGSELYRETETVSTYGDASLVAIFNTTRKNLSPISQIPPLADTSNPITVHMIDSSKTDILLMYLSFEGDSYCVWNDKAYKVSPDSNDAFFSSPYSESLFSNSRPPSLMTADGDEILPTSADWYYCKKVSLGFIKASKVTLTAPLTTYHITGEFNVSFATAPNASSVEIFNGEELIYSGPLNEAHSIKVDSTTPLRVTISAQWDDPELSFHGTAEYDVSVIIHKRAEFSVTSDTLSSNDFTILKIINVADMSKLKFSSVHISPPRFSLFGENAYAILFRPDNFEGDNIEFTVSYGASLSTFNLSVLQSDNTQNDKIYESMESLGVSFSNISASFSSPPYIFGRIITPESYGFTNTLKVGDADGEYYSYRRVYTTQGGVGTDVLSLSGGVVSQIGEGEELGKYAVVDIGLGLSVIYSNLSSTDVFVGDVLATGDVIGKSGHIPRGENGFSLTLWYNGNLFDSELLFINS